MCIYGTLQECFVWLSMAILSTKDDENGCSKEEEILNGTIQK